MKTQNHIQNGFFYSLGKCLGLPLAWALRVQKPLINWFISKGFSPKFAKGLFIAANLLILAMLLFAFVPIHFILLVIALIALAYKGTGIDVNVDPFKHEEWRMGIDGYGLYDNQLDLRIDGGTSADDE